MTDSAKFRIQGIITAILALRVISVITREAYILVDSDRFTNLEPGRFIAAAAGIVLFVYYVRGRDERWLHISLLAVYAFSIVFLAGEIFFPVFRKRSEIPMSLWEYFEHTASIVTSLGVTACAVILLRGRRKEWPNKASEPTAINPPPSTPRVAPLSEP